MSNESTMDGAAKQRVVDALTGRVRAELDSSIGSVSSEHAAAEVDRDSSYAADDLAQADAAGDLAGLFEGAAARQEAELEQLQALDFGTKDAVAPGAVVAFGGDRYVVGVVADPFDCDGVTYEGISTDSPVYSQIEGLHAGDTFTWHGHDLRIDLLA